MKHKISELDGPMLDAAVGKANGNRCDVWPMSIVGGGSENVCVIAESDPHDPAYWAQYAPSTEWMDGGPIIERERIGLEQSGGGEPGKIYAYMPNAPLDGHVGPTPLIAAMRAFVSSKFGDEVEL